MERYNVRCFFYGQQKYEVLIKTLFEVWFFIHVYSTMYVSMKLSNILPTDKLLGKSFDCLMLIHGTILYLRLSGRYIKVI